MHLGTWGGLAEASTELERNGVRAQETGEGTGCRGWLSPLSNWPLALLWESGLPETWISGITPDLRSDTAPVRVRTSSAQPKAFGVSLGLRGFQDMRLSGRKSAGSKAHLKNVLEKPNTEDSVTARG